MYTFTVPLLPTEVTVRVKVLRIQQSRSIKVKREMVAVPPPEFLHCFVASLQFTL